MEDKLLNIPRRNRKPVFIFLNLNKRELKRGKAPPADRNILILDNEIARRGASPFEKTIPLPLKGKGQGIGKIILQRGMRLIFPLLCVMLK
jgi:hypothetical protein